MRRYPRRTLMSALTVMAAAAGTAGATRPNVYVEDFKTMTYRDAPRTTARWDTASSELGLFPFSPTLTGSHDTPGSAWDVFVSGRRAFVADGGSGLRVFDVSDPAAPAELGAEDTPDYAFAVFVSGNHAFVADGTSGLLVFDVSDPHAPALVGSGDTPGGALDVHVAGDHAFVADHASGLQIFDVSDPSFPATVGTYDTPGSAWGVDVSGDLAFIADFTSGLQVIDVSDLDHPAFIGSIDTPGWALDVFVSGNLAFVADGANGLHVIDITNPAAPRLAGAVDTPGNAYGVFVTGQRALVADETGGLLVVDVTDPTTPTPVGSYDTPDLAHGVYVQGEHAYVSDNASGLQVIEITEPATPHLTGSLGGAGFDVFVSGEEAFVVNLSGLQVIDIRDRAAPAQLGSLETSGDATGVFVSGDLALVADAGSGLQVIDVSDPAAPALLGSCDTPGASRDVRVSGDLAFVADQSGGLQLIDLSDPTAPTLVGSVATPGFARSVRLSGDLAFVACAGAGLQIFDITDPTDPTPIGFHDTPGQATDVAVSGNLAFVADSGGGLQILDVSDPAAPAALGSLDTPAFAVAVDVRGSLAFVADRFGGLLVVDVGDPTSPTLQASYDTPGDAWGVFVSGDHALVADGFSPLRVLQVYQSELETDDNNARSLPVDALENPIRRVRLSANQTGAVSWEVSADAGADWQAIQPDGAWNVLASDGPDLLWRTLHAWTVPGVDPTVTQVRLDWLYDFPVVNSIRDVPNDQGGWVRLRFSRSARDFPDASDPAGTYLVWSRIDPGGGAATPDLVQSGSERRSTGSSRRSTVHLPEALRSSLPVTRRDGRFFCNRSRPSPGAAGIDLPPGTWEILASLPAFEEDEYLVRVPTLGDSANGAIPFISFVISVHTDLGVWVSPPDSGYSVDNLAPGVPTGLTVSYNSGSGNRLTWDPAPESDFRYFRVYRSSTPDFNPVPDDLVHVTASTEWIDGSGEGWRYHYKLSCVDFAGNESQPASPEASTPALGRAIPGAFSLRPNVPNPFNPATSIRFDLPRASRVRITLYDAAGRLVTTLLDAERGPGSYEVLWQGRNDRGQRVSSGIYFVVMDAGVFHRTRKITLLK